MEKLDINLGQLFSSLSLALDIAENRHFDHSRRVAYMSNSIAQDMGLHTKVCADIYYSALIHDVGMNGQMSNYTIFEIHNNAVLKKEHCHLGAEIADGLPISKDCVEYIRYHHEEWNGAGVYGLYKNDIPIGSQIIHIADYVDIYFGDMLKDRKNIDKIKKWLDVSKNKVFCAEAVDSLLNIIEKDKFWLDLSFYNLDQIIKANSPDYSTLIGIVELEKIAKSFSRLIDSKSKFTYRHSKGLVDISSAIVDYIGYDDITSKKLQIAAYLHDLGKLAVPNNILEKPDKLDSEEFNIIKTHPYYTKLILRQVKGLEDIAGWAGNHHEKLNGKGYPEGLTYAEITREDQIISISDIYQALIDDRPYRKGMAHKDAMDILKTMVKKDYVSNNIVRILEKVI